MVKADNTLPSVGIYEDTVVTGTVPNAGQPVIAPEEEPVVVFDVADERYVGVVELQYLGSDVYDKNGVVFAPQEVKVMNSSDARGFLSSGSDFKVV